MDLVFSSGAASERASERARNLSHATWRCVLTDRRVIIWPIADRSRVFQLVVLCGLHEVCSHIMARSDLYVECLSRGLVRIADLFL